jgi:undecaprenyl diphosphate synthase
MHVAIIMDGNRRWALSHKLQTFLGHQGGVKSLESIVKACPKMGIKTLTVYALSSENLVKRSEKEVSDIFQIMTKAIIEKKESLLGNNVRVRVLGRLTGLPAKLQESLSEIVEKTKNCTRSVLQICLNYSGKDEIVQAVNHMVANKIEITPENIDKALDYPDVDLLIRPGGEHRLSNFLPYKLTYSELYFTDTLWPDFDQKELEKAMEWYNARNRRFGK